MHMSSIWQLAAVAKNAPVRITPSPIHHVFPVFTAPGY